jgi:hypothetical protein
MAAAAGMPQYNQSGVLKMKCALNFELQKRTRKSHQEPVMVSAQRCRRNQEEATITELS